VPLPPLWNDALTVFVLGPGTGESVVVHAPYGAWMVVDSCRSGGRGLARRLLDHYEARPSLLALTHPHLDHASGFSDLVNAFTKPGDSRWPKLGIVPSPDTKTADGSWDLEPALKSGQVQQAIAAVLSRWEDRETSRWDMKQGDVEALGGAKVHVISPSPAERAAARDAWNRGSDHDFNRASSAFIVEWQGRTVLLGSDLVENPGKGWSDATAMFTQAVSHDVYKLAHHGSDGARGPQLGTATATARVWIATPFARQDLPTAQDLAPHLAIEPSVHLTGLPTRYDDQSSQHRTVAVGGLGALHATPPPGGFPDCFVCVVVPQAGPCVVTCGSGAVTVTR